MFMLQYLQLSRMQEELAWDDMKSYLISLSDTYMKYYLTMNTICTLFNYY